MSLFWSILRVLGGRMGLFLSILRVLGGRKRPLPGFKPENKVVKEALRRLLASLSD